VNILLVIYFWQASPSFLTKDNVGPYLNTTSRFEGSSSQQKLIKRSGPIA